MFNKMKIRPVIIEHIYTKNTSFEADFCLDNNITFISGESDTGRTVLYSILKELDPEDQRIKCFNYLDYKKLYKKLNKTIEGKVYI